MGVESLGGRFLEVLGSFRNEKTVVKSGFVEPSADGTQVYVKTENGWGADTPVGEVKITQGETNFLSGLERVAKRIQLTEENSKMRR